MATGLWSRTLRAAWTAAGCAGPGIVDRARGIVREHEGEVTLRQVMYGLVSESLIPHMPSVYSRPLPGWRRPAGTATSPT